MGDGRAAGTNPSSAIAYCCELGPLVSSFGLGSSRLTKATLHSCMKYTRLSMSMAWLREGAGKRAASSNVVVVVYRVSARMRACPLNAVSEPGEPGY